jgi:ketosteroid isomerase-like protein
MVEHFDTPTPEQQVVERFLAAFDRRWPTDGELRELLDQDLEFIEHPNLLKPGGGRRGFAETLAGALAGPSVLRWQRYDVQQHLQTAATVATRVLWTGELAVDLGEWRAGTQLRAHCVGHYDVRDGRIVRIEQHDCYETPR